MPGLLRQQYSTFGSFRLCFDCSLKTSEPQPLLAPTAKSLNGGLTPEYIGSIVGYGLIFVIITAIAITLPLSCGMPMNL